jgi:hypothetical protein
MTKTSATPQTPEAPSESSTRRDGLFINISVDDREKIRELRENHAVNISQLLRNAIRKAHSELCETPLAKAPRGKR